MPNRHKTTNTNHTQHNAHSQARAKVLHALSSSHIASAALALSALPYHTHLHIFLCLAHSDCKGVALHFVAVLDFVGGLCVDHRVTKSLGSRCWAVLGALQLRLAILPALRRLCAVKMHLNAVIDAKVLSRDLRHFVCVAAHIRSVTIMSASTSASDCRSAV